MSIVHSHSNPWVRPLAGCEILYARGGYYETFNTVQIVWLESENPFDGTEAIRAAMLWYRNTDILQLSVRRRWTRVWFYRLPEGIPIDFDVVEDDPEDVLATVQHRTYDMKNGPLWSARLVLLPMDEAEPLENEESAVRRHRAMFILGVQHALTDAATNFVLAANFVKTLNAIASGTEANLEKSQVSMFTADDFVKKSYLKTLQIVMPKVFWGVINNFRNRLITFGGLMPMPSSHELNATRHVKCVFDEKVTKRLLEKCKQENTTVHSCVVTAANIAYYEMVKSEASKHLKNIIIYYVNTVNLRRYYPEKLKKTLGCHVSFQEQRATVSSEDRNTFWHIAREAKAELHDDLNRQTPLNLHSLLPWLKADLVVNAIRKKLSMTDMANYHYCTTNMGDVTGYFPPEDNSGPVIVTDIYRCGAADKSTMLFTLIFHTFRGRLHLSCDYYTNKIKEKHIKSVFNGTKEILEELGGE